MRQLIACGSFTALLVALVACTSNEPGSSRLSSSSGGGEGGGEGGAEPRGEGGDDDGLGGTLTVTVASVSTGAQPGTCDSPDDADGDGDGYTGTQGDCNDCDRNVSPGAIEVVITEPGEDGLIPEPADEDCDGTVDNPPLTNCDANLALDSANPVDGARALDLCHDAVGNTWGIVSATYMRANGTPIQASQQFGIQQSFGSNVVPRGGSSMLNLSSGRARTPGQPGACNECGCGGVSGQTPDPSQFPQTAPQCPGGGPGTQVYDDVALEVRLKAPTNATGFAFDFFFYTFEYPQYVCSPLGVNDQFIAWMQPPPAAVPNGNISFDAGGNPISVNAAFFQVCSGCALGEDQMIGTGFDAWACNIQNESGATGWLQTQAPVVGGQEFTLRFAIWDSGDEVLDSSVLVDNFRWIANGGTVVVETEPVPDVPN
jgi:hypothetical protein